jgi:hypothetical protein
MGRAAHTLAPIAEGARERGARAGQASKSVDRPYVQHESASPWQAGEMVVRARTTRGRDVAVSLRLRQRGNSARHRVRRPGPVTAPPIPSRRRHGTAPTTRTGKGVAAGSVSRFRLRAGSRRSTYGLNVRAYL